MQNFEFTRFDHNYKKNMLKYLNTESNNDSSIMKIHEKILEKNGTLLAQNVFFFINFCIKVLHYPVGRCSQ